MLAKKNSSLKLINYRNMYKRVKKTGIKNNITQLDLAPTHKGKGRVGKRGYVWIYVGRLRAVKKTVTVRYISLQVWVFFFFKCIVRAGKQMHLFVIKCKKCNVLFCLKKKNKKKTWLMSGAKGMLKQQINK